MKLKIPSIGFIFLFLIVSVFYSCSPKEPGASEAGVAKPARSADYRDLVILFEEFREAQKPKIVEGVPDYSRAAMERQRLELEKLKGRLAAIDCGSWPITQQVDYQLVRAEMNGLDFDHRVLRPWSRNPGFYAAVEQGPTDVPAREGPVNYGTLLLWKYTYPLPDKDIAEFRMKLRAIPKLLDQARTNLVEEAKDLWFVGARKKKGEIAALTNLSSYLAEHHPDLVPDAERAKAAVEDFRAWIEEKQSVMTAPSGIGIENYNWYMKNVHLVPWTWEEQRVIVQRELDRALACLRLEENRNRKLPRLEAPATEEEYRRRLEEAADEFIAFLKREEIFTVPDYLRESLRRPTVIGDRPLEESPFVPAGAFRDFFTRVDYLDAMPMRLHGIHWFDWARIVNEPHPSPIRRVPLLYSIWDSRAEGLATAMEEMMMHAGLLDKKSPRVRELIYILMANRAARAMGDLMMHANKFSLEDAVDFGAEWTPFNWFPKEGNSVWDDAALYLNQPGYGASYVVGKASIEKLLADCSHGAGEGEFSLKKWWDTFHATGVIPVSLIRWEMTGLDDEIKQLLLH
jgi:hypothetical protein